MHRLAFALTTVVALSAQMLPRVDAVLNGASFERQRLCPGAIAALFGASLASTTTSAQSIALPKELEESRVLVQDPSMQAPIPAPLYFVSPGQINFQIPFEVQSNITVTVSTPQGNSNPYNINLEPMAPAVFSQTADGAGAALVFDPNFQLLTREPDPGSYAVLYATGLGPTVPPLPSGSRASVTPPFNVVANPFDVYIGGQKATVAWAGLAPELVGVYQLNVQMPERPIGDIFITCEQCFGSNHVRIPRPPVNGNNIANATGSVTILYPEGHPKLIFSPAFVVAKVTAQFDVRPAATSFTLEAIATIGSTRVDGTSIQFDPAARQFTASIPSPTASSRVGNFSDLLPDITVWDFLCGPTCPVKVNIIPPARLDALLVNTLKAVPWPTSPPDGSHSFRTVTGTFTPGSTFVMDSTKDVYLPVFASFGAVPYPTEEVPVSVALYIDGQLIDVATSTYKRP